MRISASSCESTQADIDRSVEATMRPWEHVCASVRSYRSVLTDS